MEITVPKPVHIGETTLRQPRKPKKLPKANTDDEFIPYITALKESCPIESATLLGIAFHKHVMPVEAGYRRNEDKRYAPKMLCRLLTKEQVEALSSRAEEVDVRARVSNPNFNHKEQVAPNNPKEIEVNFKLSEHILLCKLDEYKPITYQKAVSNIFTKHEIEEDETVYEASNKSKKTKK